VQNCRNESNALGAAHPANGIVLIMDRTSPRWTAGYAGADCAVQSVSL